MLLKVYKNNRFDNKNKYSDTRRL